MGVMVRCPQIYTVPQGPTLTVVQKNDLRKMDG